MIVQLPGAELVRLMARWSEEARFAEHSRTPRNKETGDGLRGRSVLNGAGSGQCDCEALPHDRV